MLIAAVILAFILAFVLSYLLVLSFRRESPGPLKGFLFLFILLFFVIWAGGVWAVPVGPKVGGVSWLGFLGVALVAFLLLALALPPVRRPSDEAPVETDEPLERRAMAKAFGLLFWALILVLLATIAARYWVAARWPTISSQPLEEGRPSP